jgi:hypothetical protein
MIDRESGGEPPHSKERSCIHQAGDDVVDGDDPDGVIMFVEDGEHAEIIFVEQLENVFFAGVRGDGNEGLGLKFAHELFGSSEKDARDGDSAGEMAELAEKDDGVELLEIEVLFAEPFQDFVAGDGLADEGKFGVHHAASGGGIEGEKLANIAGFLIRHFFEEFLGGFLGKIGEKVGGGIGSHFLDDIGGFFGIEFFDDLRGEALVEFGEDSGGGFFVEGSDDALALGGREFFHHFGKIGGVEVFELLVGDAKFDAAKGIGLDEIHKFPADGTLGEFALEFANEVRRSEALEQPTNGAGNTDVDLGNAEFDVFVGGNLGEIDVVDAHDLAAGGINDLLIEKILLDREPGFVGLVSSEDTFVDVEINAAWDGFGDLVVTGNEGLETAAGDQEMGDAIGLLGGLDEKFTDSADIVGGGVISGSTHEFGGVEHGVDPFCRRWVPT